MSLKIGDISIHNRFDIEVIDARTGKVKKKVQAENIILDQWWDVMADNGYPFFRIAYGSGTGTPSASDTNLFHYEETLDLNGSSDSRCEFVDCYAWYRRSLTLSEQQQVGKTFSEIGLMSSSGKLVTHAMLTDMNGNPVSIEKTNVDIFHIFATVYVHWSLATRHRMKFTNSYTSFMAWAMGLGSVSSSYVGLYYLKSCNNNSSLWSRSSSAYWSTELDAEHKKLIFSDPYLNLRVSVSDGNDIYNGRGAGIGFVMFGDSIIMPVEDFYPGDDIVGEAIGTGDGETTRFYTKFDYPENAKIYVNGVRQNSGVTVRRCGSCYNRPAYYISGIDHRSTSSNIMYTDPSIDGASNQHNFDVRNEDDYYNYNNSYKNEPVVHMFKNENYVVGFKRVYLHTMYIHEDRRFYHQKLYGSNDLSNWTLLYTSPDFSVTTYNTYDSFEYVFANNEGNYKYYKVVGEGVIGDWEKYGGSYYYAMSSTWYLTDSNSDYDDCCQIIFDTAPASGAVITADYHTPCIAKDDEHVLDIGGFAVSYGPYGE